MAFDLDGATDRVDWSSVFDPEGDDITVACWAYPDSVSANQRLWVAHDSGDSLLGAMLYLKDSGELAFFRQWSTNWERRYRWGSGIPATGSWQHFAATSTSGGVASGMELYVDGSVPASTSTANGSGSETAHSGIWSCGGNYFDDNANYDGRICELGVWDRILSTEEIAAQAKGYSPLCFLRGLRAYMPLVRRPIDLCAGQNGTLDGTSVIAHPKIIYPT